MGALTAVQKLFLYALAQALGNEPKSKIKHLLFCNDPLCCKPTTYNQSAVQNGTFLELSCIPHSPAWVFYMDVRILRDLMHHFRRDFGITENALRGFFIDPFLPLGPVDRLILVNNITPFVFELREYLERMWEQMEPPAPPGPENCNPVTESEVKEAMKVLMPNLGRKRKASTEVF